MQGRPYVQGLRVGDAVEEGGEVGSEFVFGDSGDIVGDLGVCHGEMVHGTPGASLTSLRIGHMTDDGRHTHLGDEWSIRRMAKMPAARASFTLSDRHIRNARSSYGIQRPGWRSRAAHEEEMSWNVTPGRHVRGPAAGDRGTQV